MGRMVLNGFAFNMSKGNVNLTKDNSTKVTDENSATTGTNTKANVGDAGTLDAAKSKEKAKILTNPTELFATVVGKTHKATSDYLQENFGMTKEEADNTATAMGAVAGSATAVVTSEGVQKVVNYAKGNRIAKEDMTYTDANGNKETIKKGQPVNISNNAELKKLYENNKGKFKTEGGLPSKLVSRIWDKMKLLSSQDSMPDDTSNISDNPKPNHTKNEIKNESKHKDSPSKDIKDDNIKKDKKTQKYMEKKLNQQKIDENSPKTVDTQKVQSADVDTPKPQVQHSKINGFATLPEAKVSGMMDMMRKAPLLGIGNPSDKWQKGKIHANHLKQLGIDSKELGLNIDKDGFVDVKDIGESLDIKHKDTSSVDKATNPKSNNILDEAIADFHKKRVDTPNINVKTPSMGGKFSKIGVALASLLGIDSMASEITGGKSIISNVKEGNYADASKQTIEAIDPTIVGAQTIFQTYDAAKNNLNKGNYLSAGKDILSIPYKFGSNLYNSGYDFGRWMSSTYHNYSNNKSVLDDESLMKIIETSQSNNQIQQAQSQLTPSIAQNQLNNIATAMPLMANNSNGMAQQGLMSMVQQQYQNNTQAFNNGTMTQSAYNNSSSIQLASVLSSITNSQPISQQSLEYVGINPQSLPMNNGNVDMAVLNSMVNNTTGGNASNFAQVLRDGGVRSEFANMQREQNPTADLERLQMMEMSKNVEEMKENVNFENINVTESELETLKKDMVKIRKRTSK